MSTVPPPQPLRQVVPLPTMGETVRIEKGQLHLLLEHTRGGFLLVSHDGTHSRRFRLGLPAEGTLELRVRPPDYRVLVQVREVLCLAPRGRLRGYVTVPIQHRLVWVSPAGAVEALVDLPSPELNTSWLGEGQEGGYAHAAPSPFFADRRGPELQQRSLVPVSVVNATDTVVRPAHLGITLRDRDLVPLAGRLMAAPRRIVFTSHDRQTESVRPLPRNGLATPVATRAAPAPLVEEFRL